MPTMGTVVKGGGLVLGAAGSLVELQEKAEAMQMVMKGADRVLPERLRGKVKSGISTCREAGSAVGIGGSRRRKERQGTDAIRALGLAIVGKDGKVKAPAIPFRGNPDCRAEMMMGMVYAIRHAYPEEIINVATWDARLKLDAMKCCGVSEYGTARSENGRLEYRFVVFRGAGEMKWRGGLQTGFPDVSCTGNMRLGPEAVWFEETDPEELHDDVTNILEILAK